jgi:uncharacterized protein (DUF885 family)
MGEGVQVMTDGAAGDSGDTEGAAFDHAVDEYLEHLFAESPVGATYVGLTEHDHRLSDATAEGFARHNRTEEAWLARMLAVDETALTESQQIDLALLRAKLGSGVATADFAHWRRSVRPYLENGVFELFVHGIRPEEEATAAAVARLAQVPDMLAAGRANLTPELADPELTAQWGVRNAQAQAAFMRQGLGAFVADETLRRRLEAAGVVAAEAYDEFAEHVSGLAAKATGSFAYGQARYDAVLRIGEGFDFGAQDVRRMGFEEIERLDRAMSALAERISGNPQWRTIGQRPEDHPDSMEAMLAAYREETARARAFVVEHGIVPLPPDEACAVEPSPLFMRAAAPVASYSPPAYYGPPSNGTFNVPFAPDGAGPEEQLSRLRGNSFMQIPAVTVHEAYPGHHLHFAAAGGTNVLRQVLTSTYLVEGWGLYVEQMMGEQGYYLSDTARLGQLAARLFRAGRMVVDTSLHLGEMSIEEAITFMVQRCDLPEPMARGEVLRYCAWPTQASAYLTGAMEIERMARRWVTGNHGTLPEFHQALVTSGKLPLGVAARAIGLAAPTMPEGVR